MTDLPPPPPPWSAPEPGAGSPDAGAALSYGWKKFQENIGPMIVAVLIPLVVQVIFTVIARTSIHSRAALVLFEIVAVVGSSIAGLGLYRVALMIAAGEPADIGKAFQYDRMVEWIVFSLVFGLCVGVGIMACIIPGLLFLAFFGLAPYFFLDRGLSLGDSLRASRGAVQSGGLGFAVLLSIVVGALGALACGVGVFVTWPIAYIAVAYLYRYATGQPVAA